MQFSSVILLALSLSNVFQHLEARLGFFNRVQSMPVARVKKYKRHYQNADHRLIVIQNKEGLVGGPDQGGLVGGPESGAHMNVIMSNCQLLTALAEDPKNDVWVISDLYSDNLEEQYEHIPRLNYASPARSIIHTSNRGRMNAIQNAMPDMGQQLKKMRNDLIEKVTKDLQIPLQKDQFKIQGDGIVFSYTPNEKYNKAVKNAMHRLSLAMNPETDYYQLKSDANSCSLIRWSHSLGSLVMKLLEHHRSSKFFGLSISADQNVHDAMNWHLIDYGMKLVVSVGQPAEESTSACKTLSGPEHVRQFIQELAELKSE